MKPHNENIENYGKLCRERTKKYMTRNRQIQVSNITLKILLVILYINYLITDNLSFTFSKFSSQVIDNDNGAHMRPMPGMMGFVVPGPSVLIYTLFLCIIFLNKIVFCCLHFQGALTYSGNIKACHIIFHCCYPSVSTIQNSLFKQDKKKTPIKSSDTKRTRRDRGEMEEIMFKLFERQPNWTLRQLIQETDQPEVCFSVTVYINL